MARASTWYYSYLTSLEALLPMTLSFGPFDALWSITTPQLLALLCLYCAVLCGAALLSSIFSVVTGPAQRPVKGAHVVITGGSEGIGLAIGLEAAKQRAHVTILSRKLGKLEKAVAQLRSVAADTSAQRISHIVCDVTDARTVQKAIGQAELLGPIDFLVCAAGAAHPGYFLDQDVELFEQSMRLNYLGTVYTAKAAAGAMTARGSGCVCVPVRAIAHTTCSRTFS